MKIIYWGPISAVGKPSRGGYESANRKIVDALRMQGVDVDEYPYPVAASTLGKLKYISLLFTPLRWFKYLGKKDVILHSTPPYKAFALSARWGQKIAHLLGIRTIADMRAGSLPHYWQTKGKNFRHNIKSLLDKADLVLVEGSSYIPFIKDTIGSQSPVQYFPNTANINPELLERTKKMPDDEGKINIVYFGRVTRSKGIDVIIEARKNLPEKYRFFIAGPFGNDYNSQMLEENGIEYMGVLNAAQIEKEMQRMHFFIFPTRWQGEGQSNSLIEAMSHGLVPLTSRQGFCKEVVADCGATFPADATGADYAKAIIDITENDYAGASEKCRRHVMECHDTQKEIAKLKQIYQQLCR